METNFEEILGVLKSAGAKFDPGLSESELINAENAYNIKFPPDLRKMLSLGLLTETETDGKRIFPNWRNLNDDYTRKMLNHPKDGLKFDVEQNDFWLPSLGAKPIDKREQLRALEAAVSAAPKLIPICMHRYISEKPSVSGNSVISFWQPTDVIYYGVDLCDYLLTEWKKRKRMSTGEAPKKIPFWSEFID